MRDRRSTALVGKLGLRVAAFRGHVPGAGLGLASAGSVTASPVHDPERCHVTQRASPSLLQSDS